MMIYRAVRSLGEKIKNLFTTEFDEIKELAKSSGFEEEGRCSRLITYHPSPRSGMWEAPGPSLMPLCRAVLLKRESEGEMESLVVCDTSVVLYRGDERISDITATLNEKCPYSSEMSDAFSQYGDLDFQVVALPDIRKYLTRNVAV